MSRRNELRGGLKGEGEGGKLWAARAKNHKRVLPVSEGAFCLGYLLGSLPLLPSSLSFSLLFIKFSFTNDYFFVLRIIYTYNFKPNFYLLLTGLMNTLMFYFYSSWLGYPEDTSCFPPTRKNLPAPLPLSAFLRPFFKAPALSHF